MTAHHFSYTRRNYKVVLFVVAAYPMKLVQYLQKTMSLSRRECTGMVQEGVISINNKKVEDFSATIALGDQLHIILPDKTIREKTIEKIPFQPPKIVLFHKPAGVVVSKQDPHNKTIYDLLPDHRRDELRYIGRLDKDSTWLLLLTNDSKLVDRYENPKNNIHKVYQITVDRPLRSKDKIKMKKGVEVTEQGYLRAEDPDAPRDLLRCVTASYHKTRADKYEITITLNEWKKRHIRRLCKALGYRVFSLHRLKVGKRHIGTLKQGKRRMEKIKRTPKTKRAKK